MYKIICDPEPNYLHSCGYYERAKAQARIDSGDIYKHMYEADKKKKFIVVESNI